MAKKEKPKNCTKAVGMNERRRGGKIQRDEIVARPELYASHRWSQRSRQAFVSLPYDHDRAVV
jgi:hypothetical protein